MGLRDEVEKVAWGIGWFGAGLMAPAIYAAYLKAVAPAMPTPPLEGLLFLVGLVLWAVGAAAVLVLDLGADLINGVRDWLARRRAEPRQEEDELEELFRLEEELGLREELTEPEARALLEYLRGLPEE